MTEFFVAEGEIRQLHARFVDAVWRKDAAAFAALFTRDGEWKIAGLHIRGQDEIEATFARLLGACERVTMIVGTPLLEVDGDKASARVPATEFAKMMDGSSAMTLGIYYDRYVREAGSWRFGWRHFALQYRGPADLSAAFVDCPDYGPPPALPAADAPTFSRRADLRNDG